MKVGSWILFILFTLLAGAFLELNRQTLLGWGLFLALAVCFVMLYGKVFARFPWYGKCGVWLGYLALIGIIIAVSWPPVKAVPAVSAKNPAVTDPVMTQYGAVSGVVNAEGTVEVFAGIPYAAPPVGDLRWKAPQDPEKWEGVRACDEFAPMSMQSVNLPAYNSLAQIIGYHDYKVSLSDNYREPVSEDSLYVNVWKPAGDVSGRPVIVYIHGGSLQTGQPWYNDYSGEGFARNGAVVVNMGYRLGVFGFLATEEMMEEGGTAGNFGLLDQIKALEWVRDNIAAFGGDPENVTIVGESAGAVCVDALCVSPLAKGLFKRAILESSTLAAENPPHSYRLFEEALASGKKLMERYGCSTLSELRALPAEKIVAEMNTQHHVTIDGYVLPDTPYALRSAGQHNEEALLHGFNGEEAGPFIMFSRANLKNYEQKVRAYFGDLADDVLALYPAATDEEADAAWQAIYGAVFFDYSHYCLTRLAAAEGEPVYEYRFTKENGRLSSWHSGEMIYVFGMIPEGSKLFTARDRELSAQMNAYWLNFAATGDPNGEGLPEFPAATAAADTVLEFGEETKVSADPGIALYGILDKMQKK